jgi:ABC-type transporter Mla MlaB component
VQVAIHRSQRNRLDEFPAEPRSKHQAAMNGGNLLATIRLVLQGPIAASDVPALCEHLASLLDASPTDRVECDCSGVTTADLCTLEALARLQLTAARRGSAIVLRRAPAELVALVALAGLARILRLGVEVGRQPEHREEAGGVQEEGDAGDPVT